MELSQGRQRRHAAFDIGVVNHNVSKNFARVEFFVPPKPAIVFVRRPAFVNNESQDSKLLRRRARQK